MTTITVYAYDYAPKDSSSGNSGFQWDSLQMNLLSTFRDSFNEMLDEDMVYDWYKFTIDVEPDADTSELTDTIEGMIFGGSAVPEFRILMPPNAESFEAIIEKGIDKWQRVELIDLISVFLERDYVRTERTRSWKAEDFPTDYAGSWQTANGKWEQRCRACGLIEQYDTAVARYFGVGKHEVEEHGLQVPGINASILPK